MSGSNPPAPPSPEAESREGGVASPGAETRLERLVYGWSALAVLLGVAFGLAEVYRSAGAEGLHKLGGSALLSMLVLGKFIVFSGLHEGTPSVWTLAIMVWLIDLLCAFALASGLEGLEHAPVLGRWLRRARRRAVEVLTEYPGLEQMAFFGVVAFVLMPVAATGAITGSFAARLLGLKRVAGVLAIALGSAGTAMAFGLLAQFLGERAEDLARSPLIVAVSLLVLVIVGRMAYVRVIGKLKTRA